MAKLYFYYSAMNAGKSTALLQASYNYNERGMNTLLFTSGLDDRYEVGSITSRIGLSSTAITFNGKFDFFNYKIVGLDFDTKRNLGVSINETAFDYKNDNEELDIDILYQMACEF